MVKSMFTGVAGLKAHQQMMDVIGNNIANVNTYGFKAGSLAFQDALYQSLGSLQGGNTNVGGLGGRNPSQVGYGVTAGGISYDFGQGGAAATGRDMDCMIDGTGFFIVGPMKANDGEVEVTNFGTAGFMLSRVGRFFVDNNGYLVDGSGNYIYGFKPVVDKDGNVTYDDTKLNPLRVPEDPAEKDKRYTVNSYTIKSDGSIVGTTDDNKTVHIGQIALAAVSNPNGLVKNSGYYYNLSDNTGDIAINAAGGATGIIETGCLEMAKVELANEFAQLILTQRGYQANSKIITVTDQMLEELVNMKR